MSIENTLKESIEKADRRGRMNTLADDMSSFVMEYCVPHKVGSALEKMMRLSHRFAEIVIEERRDFLEKEVMAAFEKDGKFEKYWKKAYRLGFLTGFSAALAMLMIVLSLAI